MRNYEKKEESLFSKGLRCNIKKKKTKQKNSGIWRCLTFAFRTTTSQFWFHQLTEGSCLETQKGKQT